MIIATTDIKTMLATEANSLLGTTPAVDTQAGADFSALLEEENLSLSDLDVGTLTATEPEIIPTPPLPIRLLPQRMTAGDQLISPVENSEPTSEMLEQISEATVGKQKLIPNQESGGYPITDQAIVDAAPQEVEVNIKDTNLARSDLHVARNAGEVSNSKADPLLKVPTGLQGKVPDAPYTPLVQEPPQLAKNITSQADAAPIKAKPQVPLPQPHDSENLRPKPHSQEQTPSVMVPTANTPKPESIDSQILPNLAMPQKRTVGKDSLPKTVGVNQNSRPQVMPSQPSKNTQNPIMTAVTAGPVKEQALERPIFKNTVGDAPSLPSQIRSDPQAVPTPHQPASSPQSAPLPITQNNLTPTDVIEPLEFLESAVLNSPTQLATDTKLDMSPTTRPEIARHVAQQLAGAISHQSNRPIELTLNPEELGRLRMTFNLTDGGIAVVIATERGETLDLLRRHISTLEQEFREMGYEDVSFSFSQNNTTADNQDNNPDPSEPNSNSPTHYQASNAEDSVPIQVSLEVPTGLDLRF